ncbi:MAG: heterodisulfide reductase-related iron-sulfur binding cluster [Thermoguttaceae bacterium]|nr:heterodisulfide reductase-related iron-sulfur binding cluster [Thermoguttaceae bacterium]MDW8039512.1 (Fe-S)-binding protein [Thermoguttaceae bacterium]
MTFTRPLMWNVPATAELIFYLLIPVVLVVIIWGIVWRIRKWTIGQPEPGVGSLASYVGRLLRSGRLAEWIRTALFQGRLRPDPFALTMHLAIFWGMVVLFLGTAVATIDQDIAHLLFHWQILRGKLYQGFELVLDLFGVVLLVGVGFAGYRRLVQRPARLAAPTRPVSFWDSFPFLRLLALIAITGFLVEGLRLAQGFHLEAQVRQTQTGQQTPSGSLTPTQSPAVPGHQAPANLGSPSPEQPISKPIWQTQWLALAGEHWDQQHQQAELERIQQGGPVFPAASWAPVGWLLGKLFQNASFPTLQTWHQLLWWIHALLAFLFMIAIPWTKAFHLISSPLNLLLRANRPVGQLPVAAPSGVAKLRDFTWQQLMQIDSCTWCGRCQDVCPGYQCGFPLSPKEFVQAVDGLLLRSPVRLAKAAVPQAPSPGLSGSGPKGDSTGGSASPASKASSLPDLHGQTVSADKLWACCTCRACEDICPVGIEQPRAIIDMRRHLVDQGQVDENLQEALMNLQRYGNSFGQSPRKRTEGLQKAGLPVKDARKHPVEFLWFLGDYAAYDPRVLEATQAMARLFSMAGVSVGFLMDKEQNAGNDVRRVGEEGLFEMLRDKNLQALAAAQCQAIVTTDPHSYNTLKNEYLPSPNGSPGENIADAAALSADGGSCVSTDAALQTKPTSTDDQYPLAGKSIFHAVELLDRWIADGRLPIRRRLEHLTVTYHDPCYLGRYNGIYDPPRRVLAWLGVRLLEMPRNRENSFCCGAGGGRIWMKDMPGIHVRPAEKRIHEALQLPGVQVLVVACPKDLVMFQDAVKTVGVEDRLKVLDISQLVLQAVNPE